MTILDLSLQELLLIAMTALGAQVVGGLAGYGTGLLMPLVLVPILGAEAIVPVISLSAILTNITRVIVFRGFVDYQKALLVTAFALPSTVLGAWCYTLLSSRGAGIAIGAVLIGVVPLRRILERRKLALGPRGGALAGISYGFLTGGATGVGVILLSILMAMGLGGVHVIATDALVSTVLGVIKSGVFFWAGELPAKLCFVAVLIGAMATPGAIIARWMSTRFAAHVHNLLIEATIVAGGLILLAGSLTRGSG
jgi:uncharacterized membrane protein YfcA